MMTSDSGNLIAARSSCGQQRRRIYLAIAYITYLFAIVGIGYSLWMQVGDYAFLLASAYAVSTASLGNACEALLGTPIVLAIFVVFCGLPAAVPNIVSDILFVLGMIAAVTTSLRGWSTFSLSPRRPISW